MLDWELTLIELRFARKSPQGLAVWPPSASRYKLIASKRYSLVASELLETI